MLWVLLMSCNKAQLITEGAPLGETLDDGALDGALDATMDGTLDGALDVFK